MQRHAWCCFFFYILQFIRKHVAHYVTWTKEAAPSRNQAELRFVLCSVKFSVNQEPQKSSHLTFQLCSGCLNCLGAHGLSESTVCLVTFNQQKSIMGSMTETYSEISKLRPAEFALHHHPRWAVMLQPHTSYDLCERYFPSFFMHKAAFRLCSRLQPNVTNCLH